MRNFIISSSVIFAAICGAGCSDDGASGPAGQGGSTATTGGATGSGGAATAKGGSTGMGGATSTGGTSTAGTSGAGGKAANVGVCAERGKATANVTSFDGFEERYVIGEAGFGDDVCVVRFDVKRVGDAPAGCAECIWTHLVEFTNPTTLTNVDGACASTDRGPNPALVAMLTGQRVAIGYIPELEGAHGSARMKYFEDKKMWDVHGNATWDETEDAFRYDYRDDVCNY